ncbi:hypothetical protein [Glycomyces buryatensis]|nr:hypothetical protein [Glycomyces buryatensis]
MPDAGDSGSITIPLMISSSSTALTANPVAAVTTRMSAVSS